jgi:gliding motility-associated lipoprotein GldH
MKGRLIFPPVLLLLLLVSCSRTELFNETWTPDNMQWEVGSKARFLVEVTDTVNPYDFYILVRNTKDYPWANLYLFLTATYPDDTYSVDTLECFLASSKGEWLGKGRGFYRDNKILVNKNIRFYQTGLHTFVFEQGMRQNPLPGIESIGLLIEKAK